VSSYCYGANGYYIDINLATGLVLDKLAIGIIGTKLGLPSTCTESEAKKYGARVRDAVMSTRIGGYLPDPEPESIPEKLREYYHGMYENLLKTAGMIGGSRLDKVESEEKRQYLLKLANFFEKSGGLLKEEDFHEKFGRGIDFFHPASVNGDDS
jgi:hypothetical protein